MVRRIAFSLLLVTFADASMQMRPALLRQLDTSTSEDSLPSSIMFHQTQQDALHDFFLATEMDSELSRPRHNWRFSEGAGFPTLHYCNFTGVGCDDDLFVSTMELNETMLGGELPSSIGNLTRLVLLRVFNNMIEGSIPQSLAQISGLRNLNIGHNSLSGTLPDFSGSSLQRLILDRNSFTGTVPETLCNLHELSGLDLSGSTKLIGSLPSCLGDLSFLSKLRITDSGLTGSVPTKLCSERVMNSLSPNTFGCDAIGCASGSFQRRGGRQTSNETACEACDVPSNVIGASVCQWYHPPPRQKPVLASESIAFSLAPTASLSFPPTSSLPFAPTASPSPKARDSVDGIVQPSGAQGSPPARRIVSGCLVASFCFVIMGAAILWKARSRRPLMHTDENDTDENEDQGKRPTDDNNLYADELSSFAPGPEGADARVTSRSTRRFYLEGDETIANQQGRASILKTPMLETISADRCPNRRVRFRLPEPLPWLSDSDEESVILNHDRQQSPSMIGDAEAWVSWIMNPVFDPLSACTPLGCTPPVHEEADEEVHRSPSTDSSINSMSPILPQGKNTSSDLDFAAPKRARLVVSVDNKASLGIQDWHRGDSVSNASSITPQVSANDDDDDDDGLYQAGSEYGPGMAEI